MPTPPSPFSSRTTVRSDTPMRSAKSFTGNRRFRRATLMFPPSFCTARRALGDRTPTDIHGTHTRVKGHIWQLALSPQSIKEHTKGLYIDSTKRGRKMVRATVVMLPIECRVPAACGVSAPGSRSMPRSAQQTFPAPCCWPGAASVSWCSQRPYRTDTPLRPASAALGQEWRGRAPASVSWTAGAWRDRASKLAGRMLDGEPFVCSPTGQGMTDLSACPGVGTCAEGQGPCSILKKTAARDDPVAPGNQALE